METGEWNEEREIEWFRSAVQSSLVRLEDYLDSKLEVEKSDPGMVSKMLSNIIDNLQVILYSDDLHIFHQHLDTQTPI